VRYLNVIYASCVAPSARKALAITGTDRYNSEKPYRWESQYSEVIIVAATNLTRTEQVMQSIRDRIDRRLLTPGASLLGAGDGRDDRLFEVDGGRGL
jgi:hypothetical protein